MARKPIKPERKRLVTEEETLARLERLPPGARALAVPVYLVASFWPWWVTLLVPAILLWNFFPGVRLFLFAMIALAVLALGGYGGKKLIERLAPGWG